MITIQTQISFAGLERSLETWRMNKKGEDVRSTFMAGEKELHAQERRLIDKKKAHRMEEDEEDEEENEDDDDDDEDDDGNEEGEEEGEEEEGEEEDGEEEEATQAPSNQTEANDILPESQCETGESEISCRGMGMTHLPIIRDPEATKLDVGENNIRVIPLDIFSGLPMLEVLDLSKNQLDDDSFSQNALSNLTSVKKLNLDGNRLTMIPMLPPSLEQLSVNSNKLHTLAPHCFTGLVNLLNLELEGNSLHEGGVSPQAFKPLKRLLHLKLEKNRFRSLPQRLPRSLQTLEMDENLIEELTEDSLKGCSHLKILDLSHNLLRDEGLSQRVWTSLRQLEALDLSSNRLTSVPVNLPRSLLQVDLQQNNISHIPAFIFRHLRPGLQSLGLSHNVLTNEGIERGSFVGMFRSLAELLLDDNHLGEVPRWVRQFKNLQVLRLDNNYIRVVRQWGVCHPRNSGSTLASVNLENNLLVPEKIPSNAFNCLTDAQGLFIYPQRRDFPEI
ncbi:extracellular matrix protein 2 [Syngnathoides biaculeatus]|uniref:extracellular matrix protein 2 n=1 Tax=Syngnathoides biaculeatus TaxID=300417 RepID=UPI002ADE8F17|nr:extracellular matrix protein 2 [Syngnathoides biaculeatus]